MLHQVYKPTWKSDTAYCRPIIKLVSKKPIKRLNESINFISLMSSCMYKRWKQWKTGNADYWNTRGRYKEMQAYGDTKLCLQMTMQKDCKVWGYQTVVREDGINKQVPHKDKTARMVSWDNCKSMRQMTISRWSQMIIPLTVWGMQPTWLLSKYYLSRARVYFTKQSQITTAVTPMTT